MKNKNKLKLEKINNEIINLNTKDIPFYRFIKRNKRKQKLDELYNKKLKLTTKSDSIFNTYKIFIIEYVKYTVLFSLIEIIGDTIFKGKRITF